ncbi:Protease Do-like 8, chloroplastic [Linum perenne]
MQMLACNNLCSLQNANGGFSFSLPLPFSLGRRRFFSSICLRCSDSMAEDGCSSSVHAPRDGIQCLEEVTSQSRSAIMKRRMLLASFSMLLVYSPPRYFQAKASVEPLMTVEQVTPPVVPPGPLFPTEKRIVRLFEKNTYSVVNIFDVSLRPLLKVTGVVEIPEGNVIGNSLSRNPKPGEVVARINILTSEGPLGIAQIIALQFSVEAPEELLNPTKLGQSASVKIPGDSVASKAGLLGTTRGFAGKIVLGDVITAVDDKPVKSKSELDRVLDDYRVGDEVVLMIQRSSGETLRVRVNLEQRS